MTDVSPYPLRFVPLLRRYLWGGRRLGTVLGKPIGPEDDYAESWELCDHGADQSRVATGPLAGATLGQLAADHGPSLFGRHAGLSHFPLLLKYLDAAKTLSVQVHPNDRQAAALDPPDLGKTEAWVILAAEPGSLIYAGLKPGIDANALRTAIAAGRCDQCLYSFTPRPGDCLFIPAGTVHALGAGLLVAEIQQASDTTYRLFDWNRLGPDGRPRPLHVEQALAVIDYAAGPVAPRQPQPTAEPGRQRLKQCEKFVLDRMTLDEKRMLGGDERFHIVTVLEGSATVAGDPSGRPLARGDTVLLPAALGPVAFTPIVPTQLLDSYLP